jgi:hypothetical protein
VLINLKVVALKFRENKFSKKRLAKILANGFVGTKQCEGGR